MLLARRAFFALPLLACKAKASIDPDVAAWLGQPGDPPTPKLFAKLSRKSTKAAWSKLLAALSARYGAPKNPEGGIVMFRTPGFSGISAYETDAMAGQRVKFFFPL